LIEKGRRKILQTETWRLCVPYFEEYITRSREEREEKKKNPPN
jgi:hypothetical protein